MGVDRHKATELVLAACLGVIATGAGAWLVRRGEIEALRQETQAYTDRAIAAAQVLATANLSVVAGGVDKNAQAIGRLTQVTDTLVDTVARQNIETAKLTEQIKVLVTPR